MPKPKASQPDTLIQPVFITVYVLHLITQGLVHKLCNCESTYLETVDDVRDEMINHWLRNFGSMLRVITGSIRYLVLQNVKQRIMLVITII